MLYDMTNTAQKKPPRRKRITSIYLDEALERAFKAKHRNRKRSFNFLVNELIERDLKA